MKNLFLQGALWRDIVAYVKRMLSVSCQHDSITRRLRDDNETITPVSQSSSKSAVSLLTLHHIAACLLMLFVIGVGRALGEAASLPVDYSFDDGRGALPTGVTQSGLGTDYAASNAPYRLKFDGNSDYIQIEVDGAVQDITIGIKQYATTAPKFQIKGSSDGSTFTAIESWTINPGQNKTDTRTTSNAINSSYRHFRVCKTDGGNAGLGILVINGACSAINVTGGGTVILPAGSTDYSANDWKKKGAPTAYAAQHEYNINGSCVTLTQAADFNDGNGLQLKASAGIITISSITSTAGIDVSVVIGNGSGISIALTDATTLTGQSTGTSNISTTNTSATLTISKTTSGVGYIKTITIAPKVASCSADPTVGAASINGSFFFLQTTFI